MKIFQNLAHIQSHLDIELAEQPFLRLTDRITGNVGADNVYIPVLNAQKLVLNRHGNRICLLSGRTAEAPYPQLFGTAVDFPQLRQQIILKSFKYRIVTVKISVRQGQGLNNLPQHGFLTDF